jgi:hypothetical protein
LAHLPSLPKPDAPDELKKQLKRFQEEALKKALAAKATAQPTSGPIKLPSLKSALPMGRFSWSTVMVAVGIVVALGAGLLAYQAARNRTTVAGGDTITEKLEASQPQKPAWVDQTFFRETDRLLFVGHSTLVADKADGFAEAENGALEEVANQAGLSIRDPLWIDNVRGQYEAFRSKAIGDLEKASVSGDAAEVEKARRVTREARKRVAEALRRTSGGLAPTERNDLYWEKVQTTSGVKYQVSIRYAIPKANFEKLVEAYQTPELAMNAQAVSYFPELGWRFEVTEGAIITKVLQGSSLRFAGIQEGDLVLSGMDRVVHDARSWKRVLDEEAAALSKTGGVLLLKVKRGDSPAVDTRLRIAAGGQASGDSTNTLRPSRRRDLPSQNAPQKTRNQTGNIWDDNPEE